jgi:hypothetical protein
MRGKLLGPVLAVSLIAPAAPAWAREPTSGVLVVQLAPTAADLAAHAPVNRYHVGDKIQVTGSLKNLDGTPEAGRVVLVTDPRTSGPNPGAKAQTLSLTTDGNGLFSGTFTADTVDSPLSTPGNIQAVAHTEDADFVAEGSSAAAVLTYATALEDPVGPPDTVPKNTAIVFQGQMFYTDWEGTERPYTGSMVLSQWDGRKQVWHKETTTTANDFGRFWISGQATVQNFWHVGAGDAGYDPSYKQYKVLVDDGMSKIAVIEELTGGGTVKVGTEFTIKGRSYLDGPGTAKAVNGDAEVELSWSSDLKKWNSYTAARTDAQGRFSFTPVALGDTHWRIFLPGHKVGGFEVPSLERQVFVNTKAVSKLTADATPEPVRHHRRLAVRGTLSSYAHGKWTVLKRTKVALYFRRRGSRTWTFVGWAKTDSRGHYTMQAIAYRDGYWQARYLGDGDRFTAVSHADYVDVR